MGNIRINPLLNRVKLLKKLFFWKHLSPKRKRYFQLLLGSLFVVLIPLAVIWIQKPPTAKAAWLDENWLYRQRVAITNSSGSNQTDYQIAFTLDTATLITAGKLQANCNDLRITDANGKLIPHWIQTSPSTSACNQATTKIWTRIPSITTSGATIYLYYGNTSAINVQNGDKVFEFFDDFNKSSIDGTKWTTSGTSSGTIQISSNKLNITQSNSNNTYTGVNSVPTFSEPSITETSMTTTSFSADCTTQWLKVKFSNTNKNIQIKQGENVNCPAGTFYHAYYSGSWTTIGNSGMSNGSTKVLKVVRDASAQESIYEDGSQIGSSFAGTSGATRIALGGTTNTSSSFNISFDWVFARKYTATEPTIGSPSSEEQGLSPVAYWAFDEGQGQTAQDATTSNNDGTLGTDGNSGSDDPTWITEDQCISGKCLKFDGGDYVSLTNDLRKTDSAGTIEAWVKFTGSGSANNVSPIVDLGGTAAGNFVFTLRRNETTGAGNCATSNTLQLRVNPTVNNVVCGSTVLNNNTWYHIAVTGNGSTYTMFVNGVPETITTPTGSNSGSWLSALSFAQTTTASIGRQLYNGSTFSFSTSLIDEPKIYNFARTAAQIKTDFNAGSGAASKQGSSSTLGAKTQEFMSEGLISYWKMDETSGTSVADASGNGKTGTLTNAQETGTGEAAGTTTTLVDADNSNMSTTDDVYNNMILRITGGCSITTGTERVISDYTGSSKTITVAVAFSAETDNCTFEIRHQTGGKYGYGLLGDSINDNASIPSMSFTGTMSISAWFKTSASSDAIFATTAPGTGDYFAMRINSNRVEGLTDDTASWTSNYVRTTSNVNDNTWHHAVFTVNGTTLKMYLDGKWEATDTAASSASSFSAISYIGYSGMSWAQVYANGFRDEIRLYNRVLSPKEISDLYNWSPPARAEWNFEEGSGTSVLDTSGSGYNGTWSGTAAWAQGKYGKGGSFNGSSLVNASTPLNVGYSDMTIEGWIKTSSANQQSLLSNILNYAWEGSWFGVSVGTGKFLGYIRDSGNFQYLNSENSNAPSGGISISDNKWHHVAFSLTRNGNAVSYVDGVKDQSVSISSRNNSINGSYNTGIGGQVALGDVYLTGGIDQVKIYNYARTQKQIIESMNANHPAVGSPIASPIGYWDFDEGADNTCPSGNDVCNQGHGGAALDGAGSGFSSPATYPSGWTQAGKFGRALVFDGTDDYIQVSDQSSLDITGKITLSAWINPDVVSGGLAGGSGNVGIIAKFRNQTGATNQRAYNIGIDTSTSKLFFVVSSDGTSTGNKNLDSTSTISASTWTHVLAVFEPSTSMKIYINGVLDASTTTSVPSSIASTAAPLWVGLQFDSTNANLYFDGKIDEPKIYNYALTADEVKTDYNRGSSMVLGTLSDMSALTGGTVASSSSQAEYCVPGDNSTCTAPVGRWDFEEKKGTTTYDTSGNGYNGNLAVSTSSPTWTTGKVGSALNFNGSNQYVDAGDNLDLIGSAMTLSVWVKPTVCSEYAGIVTKLSSGGNWRLVEYNGTSCNLAFGIRDVANGHEQHTSTGALIRNQWNHIVVTFDNSATSKMYINGKFDSQKTNFTLTRGNTGEYLYFGYNPNNLVYYNGAIDQVRIYNYVRTPAQIAWEYNRGAPIAHWDFDECEGTTLHDLSGNGYNATITIGASGENTVGTCTTSSTAWGTGATGKRNYSLSFDGTDDEAKVSQSALGLVGSNDITLEAWVNSSTVDTTNRRILSYTQDANNGYSLIRYGTAACSSNFIFEVKKAGSVYGAGCINTTAPSNDTWYHVVGTFNNTTNTSSLYVNGTLITTTGGGALSLPTTTNTLFIGSRDANSYWQGLIDNVKIYNYALHAKQIKLLYNNGAVNFAPSTGAP